VTAGLEGVRLAGVTKVFGAVRALFGVGFEARRGDVIAVMGGNGAGKSTLLSILALAARPTRGTVSLDGRPADPGDPSVRARIGLLSHQPLLYPDLTGRENLRLFAGLHGLRDPGRAVADVERRLDLAPFVADRPARVLSRGQLQRVSLARALIHSPALLLLDEPAAGLDSAAVARIEECLREHSARGGIAVMVTHEPELAARTAGRAVMLRAGRVAADVPAPEGAEGWRALYRSVVECG
jgi:heme exporter protein A